MTSKIRSIVNWIVAVALHAYIGGGILRLWSSIYRFVWSRKHKNDVLQKLTVEEAAKKMAGFQWRADSWRALLDVVDSPQAVQAHGFDPATKDNNDCSDEAIYLTNVIEDPQIQKAEFLVITWFNPEKNGLNPGYDGHCVCLLSQMGLLRYMDYGQPGALHSTESQVATDVVRDYTRGKGTMLSWYVSDKNLKPLRGGYK